MSKPKNKPKSREEILEAKRRKERERYARIKSDPIRLAAYKEKDRQKYIKERATGIRKTIDEMTEEERFVCRKSWRVRSARSYKKKCAAKQAPKDLTKANKPSCDNGETFAGKANVCDTDQSSPDSTTISTPVDVPDLLTNLDDIDDIGDDTSIFTSFNINDFESYINIDELMDTSTMDVDTVLLELFLE